VTDRIGIAERPHERVARRRVGFHPISRWAGKKPSPTYVAEAAASDWCTSKRRVWWEHNLARSATPRYDGAPRELLVASAIPPSLIDAAELEERPEPNALATTWADLLAHAGRERRRRKNQQGRRSA